MCLRLEELIWVFLFILSPEFRWLDEFIFDAVFAKRKHLNAENFKMDDDIVHIKNDEIRDNDDIEDNKDNKDNEDNNDDNLDEDDNVDEDDSIEENDSLDEDDSIDEDDIDQEMAQLNDDIRELDERQLLVDRQLLEVKERIINLMRFVLSLNAEEMDLFFVELDKNKEF